MDAVTVFPGEGPIVLGVPHCGTFVPEEVFADLTIDGRRLIDTDWHVDRLYDGLLPSATVVRANFHRYVVDPNRDPDGASLYPGQNTTGLVPLTDFDGVPLWQRPPSEAAIQQRAQQWHRPYHEALDEQLRLARQRHGVAILFDCHSIRSQTPFLFEGTLPDFNLGTNEGQTCAAELQQAVTEICESAPGYSSVVNGRFKGGWSTRHYGRPMLGCHAIQMELAQSTYLTDEAEPFTYDQAKADRLRPVLRNILYTLEEIAPQLVAVSGDKS